MATRLSTQWRRRHPRRSQNPAARRIAPPLEKVEQAHIQQLLTGLGAEVYVLGTRRSRGKNCPNCGTFVPEHQGTRQTSGIGDLFVFMPPRPVAWTVRPIPLWIECKRVGGEMSPEQEKFKGLCQDSLLEHVDGTLDAVITWLIGHNYARAEQFAHYRQPLAKTERVDG